jgi:predicted NACHT family NTPase
MKKLRKRIAQDAKKWLKEHAPEYIQQQAKWSEISPDKFIKVNQYRRYEEKDQEQVLRDKSIKDEEQIESTRINIRQAIENNTQLVILGDPGLGKTTSLRYITYRYARNKKNLYHYIVNGHEKMYRKWSRKMYS